VTHSDHLEACWQRWRERLEAYLDRLLPAANAPPKKLHAAMRYAAIGAGKRYRAALVYATGTSLGASEESLDAAAGAIELIHAFSLIHDDLPAMDDDDLRRGKPTCHKAFGEATAILAGDALQTIAFEAIAAELVPQIAPARRLQMLHVLARDTGWGCPADHSLRGDSCRARTADSTSPPSADATCADPNGRLAGAGRWPGN